MVKRFMESGHPVFIHEHQCFASWNSEKENNRDTIHFTADASNTEFSYRTIHSANQLSIYGAVAGWCEEFGLKLDETSESLTKTENEKILKEVRPQEVNSLVQTPRNEERATGNRLRELSQNFETLGKEAQFTRICEDATFFHRVSIGMRHKTVADVDDGFGGRTPACREYTRPHADSNSRIYAAIPDRTIIIGPVFKFIL